MKPALDGKADCHRRRLLHRLDKRWRASLVALSLVSTGFTAAAATQTYSGSFASAANTALVASDLTAAVFTDDAAIANNLALYDFTVATAGAVTIASSGFAAGGADPYFSLFAGTDGTATFLNSNYTQAFSTGGDFSFSTTLATGAYRLAIGTNANLSFAENSGSGTLADGFTGFGSVNSLGDASYRIAITTLAAPVPEPSAWLLLAVGGLAFGARRAVSVAVARQ